MPVPAVPDSRRFAKHLTGIIHSELLEIPGIVSQEMRLVRHDPAAGTGGPTTCAEIDVVSVSGSRCRILVYPLPPDHVGLTDEEMEQREISPDIDVESLLTAGLTQASSHAPLRPRHSPAYRAGKSAVRPSPWRRSSQVPGLPHARRRNAQTARHGLPPSLFSAGTGRP